MDAGRILIVYGTSYGQTAKIATRLRNELAVRGWHVTLARGDALPAGLSVREYDGVVVGASVIRGHHQRYIERFVRANRRALRHVPSAFFSVSGSAAGQRMEQRTDAWRVLGKFLAITGWQPRLTATFGGAISYTRYSRVVRWIITRIVNRAGGATDTSRDHEYTDWLEVERFALQVERMVEAMMPHHPRAWAHAERSGHALLS